MLSDTPKHYPVLLNELISIISPQHGGTFIDCTFGQGGYSEKILTFKNTKIIALDRDIDCQKKANEISDKYHQELVKNQEVKDVVDNSPDENEISFTQEALETEETKQDLSNDLKEFGVDTNEPDLFSSKDQDSSSDDILSSLEEESEDDLEIPAFLRRQKN